MADAHSPHRDEHGAPEGWMADGDPGQLWRAGQFSEV